MVIKSRKPRMNTGQSRSRVTVPASSGFITRNRAPRANYGNSGTLTINHCEPFSTAPLLAAGALSYNTLPVIPSFIPWLSGLAANFGKWRWLKMRVYYVPSCPTSTQGEVAMGFYYDQTDAIAASFVQVSSMDKAVAFAPWMGASSTGGTAVQSIANCQQFDKPRYNYIGSAAYTALPSNDKNPYTPIILAVATQGSTAAVTIAGRFWVEYTVELLDPIVSGINT